MNKMDPLNDFLRACGMQSVTLSFDKIDSIISIAGKGQLSATARNTVQWWENGTTTPSRQCAAWMNAGYKTVDIRANQLKQQMTFEKI